MLGIISSATFPFISLQLRPFDFSCLTLISSLAFSASTPHLCLHPESVYCRRSCCPEIWAGQPLWGSTTEAGFIQVCVQKRRLQRSVLHRLNAQWVIKRSGSGEVLRTERGEKGARRSRRKKEQERKQVRTLGLNQEVLKENWITGCCVRMQLWRLHWCMFSTAAVLPQEIRVVWSLVWSTSASPAWLELPEL